MSGNVNVGGHTIHTRSPNLKPSPLPEGIIIEAAARTATVRVGCLSFAHVLAALFILTLSFGCSLVWYIGYRGTEAIVSNLSAQVRTQLSLSLTSQFSSQVVATLHCAEELEIASQRTFPNMVAAQGRVIRHASGVLGDLTNLLLRYPSINQLLIVSGNDVFILVSRNKGGPNRFVYTLGDRDSTADALSRNASLNNYKPGSLFIEQFLPFRGASNPNNNTWLQTVTSAKATYTDTRSAIGPPLARLWYPPVGQAAACNQTFYQRALLLNGTLAWTGMQVSSGSLVMGAAQEAKSSDASFSFVALATSTLDSLDLWLQQQWMAAIPSGNGAAVLLLQDGRLMGTSLVGGEHQVPGTIITSCTHPFLQAMTPLLIADRFLDLQRLQPIFAQTTGAEQMPMPKQPQSYSLSLDGRVYHMHVSLTNSFGLSWITVIVTLDSDFENGLDSIVRNTAVFSAAVLLLSIIVSFVVAFLFITRPIGGIIAYMQSLNDIVSNANVAHKQRVLEKLRDSWEKRIAQVHTILPATTNAPSRNQVGDVQLLIEHNEAHAVTANLPTHSTFMLFHTREIELLHASFGSMLRAMTSNTELEKVNEAKRRFIRYIFHEVRVPFNAIVLGLDQMQFELEEMESDAVPLHHAPWVSSPTRNCVRNGTMADTLALLRTQTDQCMHILNDVLSLQKIEDCAMMLEYAPFSMEDMIEEAIRTSIVGQNHHGRGVGITRKITSLNGMVAAMLISQGGADVVRLLGTEDSSYKTSVEVPSSSSNSFFPVPLSSPNLRFGVLGDRLRLLQVLCNFLSNAIKFGPPDNAINVTLHIEQLELMPSFIDNCRLRAKHAMDVESQSLGALSLSLAHGAVGACHIRVSVRDAGPGVPPEHRANLFTSYMQIQAGTLQGSQGTGLGLSICKSIMQLHQGFVGFEPTAASENRHSGAIFFFKLPISIVLLSSNELVTNDDIQTPVPAISQTLISHNYLRQIPLGPRLDSTSDHDQSLSHQPPAFLNHSRSGLKWNHSVATKHKGQNITLQPVVTVASGSGQDEGAGAMVVQNIDSLPPALTVFHHSLPGSSLPPGHTKLEDLRCDDTLLMDVLPEHQTRGLPSSAARSTLSSAAPISRLLSVAVVSSAQVGVSPIASTTSVGVVQVRSIRALVVEDSVPNRKLLCAVLKRLKFQVECAENGQECVDMCTHHTNNAFSEDIGDQESKTMKRNMDAPSLSHGTLPISSPLPAVPHSRFDIIFMDNTMPIMDGMQASRILRSRGLTLPIIGVTGNALVEDVAAFITAGADRVLIKPVNSTRLLEVCQQYLPALANVSS